MMRSPGLVTLFLHLQRPGKGFMSQLAPSGTAALPGAAQRASFALKGEGWVRGLRLAWPCPLSASGCQTQLQPFTEPEQQERDKVADHFTEVQMPPLFCRLLPHRTATQEGEQECICVPTELLGTSLGRTGIPRKAAHETGCARPPGVPAAPALAWGQLGDRQVLATTPRVPAGT